MKNQKDDLTIRLAKRKDLAEIARIYQVANSKAYPEDKWNKKEAVNHLADYFKLQPDLFFVAYKDEKIIAGIWGRIEHYSGPDLTDVDLFVDPESQNRGVGRGMLKYIIKKAATKYQIGEINFLANNKKDFPLVWYKKIGMKETPWFNMEGKVKEVLKNLEKS